MTQKLNTFQRVRDLDRWPSIAFCAAMLERMLPNYQLFSQGMDFGDPEQLRNTLNSVWEYLMVPGAKINFTVQLEKIELAIPDAAEFDNFGVYPAIDAGMALMACLQLIKNEDEHGAVVVSKLSQGSVEAFIDATEPDVAEIKQHPLMQWEVAFQNELLDLLSDNKNPKAMARAAKALALEEGVSNLGISLEDDG